MTEIDRDKINYYQERIRKNLASAREYSDYENLLIKNGITKDEINKCMHKEHLPGYDELIYERKRFLEKKRSKTIETVVVAGLIGLGTAAIIIAPFNREE